MRKPKAQAQLYDEADDVRIFDDLSERRLMDVDLRGKGDARKMADVALTHTPFERTGQWRRTEWGYVATLKRL